MPIFLILIFIFVLFFIFIFVIYTTILRKCNKNNIVKFKSCNQLLAGGPGAIVTFLMSVNAKCAYYYDPMLSFKQKELTEASFKVLSYFRSENKKANDHVTGNFVVSENAIGRNCLTTIYPKQSSTLLKKPIGTYKTDKGQEKIQGMTQAFSFQNKTEAEIATFCNDLDKNENFIKIDKKDFHLNENAKLLNTFSPLLAENKTLIGKLLKKDIITHDHYMHFCNSNTHSDPYNVPVEILAIFNLIFSHTPCSYKQLQEGGLFIDKFHKVMLARKINGIDFSQTEHAVFLDKINIKKILFKSILDNRSKISHLYLTEDNPVFDHAFNTSFEILNALENNTTQPFNSVVSSVLAMDIPVGSFRDITDTELSNMPTVLSFIPSSTQVVVRHGTFNVTVPMHAIQPSNANSHTRLGHVSSSSHTRVGYSTSRPHSQILRISRGQSNLVRLTYLQPTNDISSAHNNGGIPNDLPDNTGDV